MKAIKRTIAAAKGSFFLFGPRGTGKSVWLKEQFPEVARDAGVKRSTIDGYFKILEDMLITRSLPVFTKRAKRKAGQPLLSAVRPQG